MRAPTWTHRTLLCALLASGCVRANTETLSFSAGRHVASSTGNDPRLVEPPRGAALFDIELRTLPVEQLHFLAVDALQKASGTLWDEQEQDFGTGAWTVRLCWPASSPADFGLSLLSSSAPRDPPELVVTAHNPRVPNPSTAQGPPHVAYTLLVEPVHLGIPASCIPLVGVLVAVLLTLWGLRIPGRVADALEMISGSEVGDGVQED